MEEKGKGLSQSSKALSPGTAVREQFQGTEVAQRAEQAAIRVAAQARAEVESAFIMAMKRPRNRDQARFEILEACKNKTFAEIAMYKKPVGKKNIDGQWVQQYVEGPSIRFAEEMMRAWTNVKVQSMVIYEDAEHRITFINIIDLETNLSYSTHITVEKTVERKNATGREVVGERVNTYGERVFIVTATDDEIRNKEAAFLSKEIRNSSLRLIPKYIEQDAIIQIKKTIEAGVSSDIESAKKQILDAFAALGVKPTDIEQYLGHGLSTVSPAKIADLRTVYNTIKNGEATWAEYVTKETAPEAAGLAATSEPAKDIFKPGDVANHQGPAGGVKKGDKK